MAEKELELTLTWENNKLFKAVAKEPGDDPVTVIHVDENGSFADMWYHISAAMSSYFSKVLTTIGDDMKKP